VGHFSLFGVVAGAGKKVFFLDGKGFGEGGKRLAHKGFARCTEGILHNLTL